jgi:hypothetical protein
MSGRAGARPGAAKPPPRDEMNTRRNPSAGTARPRGAGSAGSTGASAGAARLHSFSFIQSSLGNSMMSVQLLFATLDCFRRMGTLFLSYVALS